ncbi:MAG: hypothetical protein EOP04_22350 [Proteobacteria bacterium]|nr:MAG: hypothetical protein EOP04_22350 [Pseudomonadota bacterium]
MKHLLEDVFNPVEFIEENYDLEKTSSMFNQYLRFDGYQIQSGETQSRVISIAAQTVDFTIDDHNISIVTSDYINIQIDKCRQKLGNSDYDGAITNARSLVEVVLLDIVFKLTNEDKEYDGDLIKLYRQVQKLLNLTPDNPNLDSTLKQVLSGLTSVVTGLSGMRNKLSDAHATRYRASKHHALLAINSAKTLCDFIYDSMDFQKKE